MKAIITLIFILFIGCYAQAQGAEITPKENIVNIEKYKEVVIKKNNDVTLYKYKYSRVKNALLFITKRNKSKLV